MEASHLRTFVMSGAVTSTVDLNVKLNERDRSSKILFIPQLGGFE